MAENVLLEIFAQQFKRSCLPDGPKVGSVAVSSRGDLRMPSDACVKLWREELDQLKTKQEIRKETKIIQIGADNQILRCTTEKRLRSRRMLRRPFAWKDQDSAEEGF